MTQDPSIGVDASAPSDAELISAVRGGDSHAYGLLFERHRQAALRLARQIAGTSDADDLVSDAFTKVFKVLKRGQGPDLAFRAYLLTAVRRLHLDKVRGDSKVTPSDEMEQFDPGMPFTDPAVAGFEHAAAAKAFASLPERWQLVLWHLEVENQKPAEIAPLLGMSPNSISALAYRAREGLRQAYLQMHLADAAEANCRWVTERLGAHVRKGLSRRDAAKVERHLDECARCAGVYLELTAVNSSLAGVIAPILLGSAAAGYLAATGSSSTVLGMVASRLRHFAKSHGAIAAGGTAASVAAVAVATAVVLGGGHDEQLTDAPGGLSPAITAAAPGDDPATHRQPAHPAKNRSPARDRVTGPPLRGQPPGRTPSGPNTPTGPSDQPAGPSGVGPPPNLLPAPTETTSTTGPTTRPATPQGSGPPSASEPTATEPTAIEPTVTQTSQPTTSTAPTTSSAPTTTVPTATSPTATVPTSTIATTTDPTATTPTGTTPTSTVPTSTVPTSTVPTSTITTTTDPTTTTPTATTPTSTVPTSTITTSTITTSTDPTTTAPTATTPTATTPPLPDEDVVVFDAEQSSGSKHRGAVVVSVPSGTAVQVSLTFTGEFEAPRAESPAGDWDCQQTQPVPRSTFSCAAGAAPGRFEFEVTFPRRGEGAVLATAALADSGPVLDTDRWPEDRAGLFWILDRLLD